MKSTAVVSLLVLAALVTLLLTQDFLTRPAATIVKDAASRVDREQKHQDGLRSTRREADRHDPGRLPLPGQPDPDTLLLEVVNWSGMPIVGAQVWAWVTAGKVASSASNAKGFVRFIPATSAGRILVMVAGKQPRLVELRQMIGSHRISLGGGERVQGSLRVDGGVPEEPIELTLLSNRERYPEFLPASVRRQLEQAGLGLDRVQVKTGTDGSFEFGGLTAGWTGVLCIPIYYWFTGATTGRITEDCCYRLQSPQTGLQFDITELPSVRGSLVWEDTGEAASEAAVRVRVMFTNGLSLSSLVKQVDAQGCFRVGLAPASSSRRLAWRDPNKRGMFQRIDVDFFGEGLAGPSKRRIDSVADLRPPGNIGVTRLVRAGILHVLVRNPSGQPVPGARLVASATSEPTDSAGRGVIKVANQGRRQFLVGARGYQIGNQQATSGSGTEADPLVFVLPRGNDITVRLSDLSGEPPPGTFLTVISEGQCFTSVHDGLPTWLHAVIGTEFRSASWGGEQMVATYSPDKNGHVLLASLVANAKLRLTIHDELNQTLALRMHTCPDMAGSQVIEMVVHHPVVTLMGVVRDDEHRAVRNADVSVTSGGTTRRTRTSIEGSFRFQHIYSTGRKLAVEVKHRGYSLWRSADVVPHVDQEPLSIDLVKGHDVRIAVVDANGRFLPVDDVLTPEESRAAKPIRIEPGVFLFQDLPSKSVRFVCKLPGHSYELRHETTTENARMMLPVMGRCRIAVPANWHSPNDRDLFASIASMGEPAAERFIVSMAADQAHGTIETSEFLIPPGDYSVQVQRSRDVHARKEDVLGSPKRMRVAAGALTRCRMEQ